MAGRPATLRAKIFEFHVYSGKPLSTVEVSHGVGVSEGAARGAIADLVDLGVLVPIGGEDRRRVVLEPLEGSFSDQSSEELEKILANTDHAVRAWNEELQKVNQKLDRAKKARRAIRSILGKRAMAKEV